MKSCVSSSPEMPWLHKHIVWLDIVPTPDAQTKEPVQASRGQMTNTPKPWPDIIPTDPPSPTSRQTPQKNGQQRGTYSEHIREVKEASHWGTLPTWLS